MFRQEKMPNPLCNHNVMKEVDCHLTYVEVRVKDMSVIAIYRHPKFPTGRLCSFIETYLNDKSGDMILIGDLNLHMQKEGNKLRQLFSMHRFESKTPQDQPTTNGNTTIDICFSNANVTASLMETYYSYHKSMCRVVKIL